MIGRLGLQFEQVARMHRAHDRAVDDHVAGLDLAGDAGFFADHEDAVAARPTATTSPMTSPSMRRPSGETEFTADDRAFADQACRMGGCFFFPNM